MLKYRYHSKSQFHKGEMSMAESLNLYEILGVSPDATPEQIKQAHRQVAKQFHPDLHPDDSEADEKMKWANQAYTILGKPDKRADYDRQLLHFKEKAAQEDFQIQLMVLYISNNHAALWDKYVLTCSTKSQRPTQGGFNNWVPFYVLEFWNGYTQMCKTQKKDPTWDGFNSWVALHGETIQPPQKPLGTDSPSFKEEWQQIGDDIKKSCRETREEMTKTYQELRDSCHLRSIGEARLVTALSLLFSINFMVICCLAPFVIFNFIH
jgi:hypothetical protein